MKQGTTATLKVKLDVEQVESILFTFANSREYSSTPLLQKEYPTNVEKIDDEYHIGLTQADTNKLAETFYLEAQCNLTGNAVVKSLVKKIKMPHTLYTKMLSSSASNGEEVDVELEAESVVEVHGGSGTSDYNDLENKPRINSVTLSGNKSLSELGIASISDLNSKQDTLTDGNGISITDSEISVDLDENSILEFNNHKLSADTSGLQPTISGGNGIDVSSDVVSVDNGDYLYFDNGKLSVNQATLGASQLRQWLADTSSLSAYKPLATKQYVDNLISTSLKRLVVEQLPQNPNTYTIYMVLRQAPTTNNIYDEYMYINNAWELIGSTEVDLSNYYTKSEVYNKQESNTYFQERLTVGNGIDITSSTISAKIVSSGNILKFSGGELVVLGSDIASDNSFKNVMPYDTTIRQGLTTGTNSPLQPKLTAGTNITIDANNVISASGGGLSYTFTDGLKESSGTVGIDLASGSKLLIDANDKLDVDLSSKQDTIDSTHKLSADNVDDTSTTNKFVPTSAQADSGKFLRVNASGNAEWQTVPQAENNSF